MADELDLLRDMRDVEPLKPRAYEEARAVLRSAMATPEAPTRRARWSMRRKVGVGTAALIAASAATALVVTSTSPSSAPLTTHTPAANPILTKLVAEISPMQPESSGDATLTVRNLSPTSDKVADNGIDLYTDDGMYYWGNDADALRRAIAGNRGDSSYKRGIAVALYAVKGDLGTARARMSVANFPPGTDLEEAQRAGERTKIEKLKAAAKARGEKYVPPKPPTPEQKKAITDNHIWSNAIDTLIAAPKNPQVRAGVLRIMATMPKVKVTKTTTAGQPTLALSDTWAAGSEKLVINANTGQPVALTSSAPNAPNRTMYYHTTRVNLTDIKSGKF
ncbi:hypothetical protein [Actinomadura bangladeshensis]|uniref:Uncharacterized protein n=1 Tax=Actinomadura bangladeshensis TaxID=453573 RepID=A0A4R4NFA7_9ACTN|nr:hypothetical protein [Actinomadura bangladeshensis]TDC05422.1 hypothetical protein E1284_35475 [Actinomadura bangladeshensis]